MHRLTDASHQVWTLGRSRSATLTIRHPHDARESLKVSRYHAEIIRCWEHWLLRSLTHASTRIDGISLTTGDWHELEHGQRIELGHAVLIDIVVDEGAMQPESDDWAISLASISDAPTLRSRSDAAK